MNAIKSPYEGTKVLALMVVVQAFDDIKSHTSEEIKDEARQFLDLVAGWRYDKKTF